MPPVPIRAQSLSLSASPTRELLLLLLCTYINTQSPRVHSLQLGSLLMLYTLWAWTDVSTVTVSHTVLSLPALEIFCALPIHTFPNLGLFEMATLIPKNWIQSLCILRL